jgi:hypothetical protein
MSRNLSDEFRKHLMESASWEKAGFEVERVDEGFETEEEFLEEAQARATEVEDAEEISEDVHVCPLCVSQLEEPIDEERLVEHLDVVFGLADRLSQLNEGEEDVEEIIANALTDLLFDEEDEA